MKECIAERKLLYSLKGEDKRSEFTIGMGAPYFVQPGTVDFLVGDEGCSGCNIYIIGLNETYPTVYGADSLQAITIASNAIDWLLKRLSKKYDLFYLSGEPYFDT